MKSLSHLLVAAVLLLTAGCAHPTPVRSDAGSGTAYVDGAVKAPGKLHLSSPFTIEHALRQAGGLDEFEQNQNRSLLVRRKGKDVHVLRKDYGSFTLADGDVVLVPRH